MKKILLDLVYIHPGGVRAGIAFFYFDKVSFMKHPNVHYLSSIRLRRKGGVQDTALFQTITDSQSHLKIHWVEFYYVGGWTNLLMLLLLLLPLILLPTVGWLSMVWRRSPFGHRMKMLTRELFGSKVVPEGILSQTRHDWAATTSNVAQGRLATVISTVFCRLLFDHAPVSSTLGITSPETLPEGKVEGGGLWSLPREACISYELYNANPSIHPHLCLCVYASTSKLVIPCLLSTCKTWVWPPRRAMRKPDVK